MGVTGFLHNSITLIDENIENRLDSRNEMICILKGPDSIADLEQNTSPDCWAAMARGQWLHNAGDLCIGVLQP